MINKNKYLLVSTIYFIGPLKKMQPGEALKLKLAYIMVEESFAFVVILLLTAG